jgi:hypothetical protein
MTMKIMMLLLGAVVGAAAGGYGGVRYGSAWIVNECIHKDARDIQKTVVTLKHLRAGERDQAIELIEARMDDDLIMFDPHEPYPGLKDQTIAEMNKALGAAKEYRVSNPRKSNRPGVDRMVTDLLSRGRYPH